MTAKLFISGCKLCAATFSSCMLLLILGFRLHQQKEETNCFLGDCILLIWCPWLMMLHFRFQSNPCSPNVRSKSLHVANPIIHTAFLWHELLSGHLAMFIWPVSDIVLHCWRVISVMHYSSCSILSSDQLQKKQKKIKFLYLSYCSVSPNVPAFFHYE